MASRAVGILSLAGLGRLTKAPGTVASAATALAAIGLVAAIGPHWSVDACLVLLAAWASIACVRFGAEAEQELGGTDPSSVVADEVAGQSVALLLLPWRPLGEPGAL